MDPSDVRQSTDIWGRQIQTTILCIEKLRAINFWEFLPPLYPESYTFLLANWKLKAYNIQNYKITSGYGCSQSSGNKKPSALPWQSVFQHIAAWLPQDEFPTNFIFCTFSTICWNTPISLNSDKSNTSHKTYELLHDFSLWRQCSVRGTSCGQWNRWWSRNMARWRSKNKTRDCILCEAQAETEERVDL